uniref:Uncharacterized protein n=1 Tax=Clytia hemisphaerica TaxID=252671 RepID=A0A7M5VBP1_9CNID|eukprot:TCONS_00052528-protein
MKDEAATNNKCQAWTKLIFNLIIFILLIISMTTKPWGVLKIESSDKEIGNFGLWRACKMGKSDTGKVCDDISDGNFTVFAYKSNPSDIDVKFGNTIEKLCIEFRNETVLKNGTNTTELQPYNKCITERFYQKVEVERLRVFIILATVVSFLVTFGHIFGMYKGQSNDFVPAVASLLIPLWLIIGLSVFLGFYGGDHFQLVMLEYGWSMILAWICAVLSLLNTLYMMYTAFTSEI